MELVPQQLGTRDEGSLIWTAGLENRLAIFDLRDHRMTNSKEGKELRHDVLLHILLGARAFEGILVCPGEHLPHLFERPPSVCPIVSLLALVHSFRVRDARD